MENLITIAQFAKMCRTTVRTIRFYDQAGMLKPVKVDQRNKYRYYSPLQTRDFFKIKLLQNFNTPLKKIPEIIPDPNAFLKLKTAEIRTQINQKQKELKSVENTRKLLFEVDNLKHLVKLEKVGSFNLFGMLVPNEAYHTITPHMAEVQKKADELQIQHTDQFAIFYLEQEKYKPRNTKIEITIVTKGKIPKVALPKGYFFRKFPQTHAYTVKYAGPFEFITLIYEKLHRLKITEQFPVNFAPFDIHLNGLNPKVSNYERITKICFPLK